MIGPLTNHLWQSTVFALAAAFFTLALRRNRAGVRYWVWLAASVKFLVPFSLLMTLGALVPLWRGEARGGPGSPGGVHACGRSDRAAVPGDTFRAAALTAATRGRLGSDRLRRLVPRVGRDRRRPDAPLARIRRAVRGSAPLTLPLATTALDVRSAPGLLEPGVVGIWRPILLLPERIADCLTPESTRDGGRARAVSHPAARQPDRGAST